MKGYLRQDGRKGIRNIIVVAYLVECAHHVSRLIVSRAGDDVQLIGFPGCYPNAYALKMMTRLCTHPNVSAALIVSLGCEGFNREALHQAVKNSGRPVKMCVIQECGGTRPAIETGVAWIKQVQGSIRSLPTAPLSVDELMIATICGGSDGTSGISANPAVGVCFDKLVEQGATCLFEETGELIGCEQIMAERAVTPELGEEIKACVTKAAHYYTTMGYGSFAPGNADGGLTTQEEKSMGAYMKSGYSQISGIIKPGDIPPSSGLYLLDVVPDGEPRFGFPNISDNAEIMEMVACGAHLTLFTTGRGSVVGSAISPVIKICANPETYNRMQDDMDVNAGRIILGEASLEQVGNEVYGEVLRVAAGGHSKSEELGHQESILTYKTFEPVGPSCLPMASLSV
ncbi:UxaA family hydrolase [Sansalvadorimonas verongulae]|uniref:UxaA family hydrolase n=1 Tax=Sansalvadorimonas verongulae TaxID=2172824 RepID=UPI0012BB918C|nr:UxaA family hydrolase [Sansalvadorimonas verongulae]MTI15198.1 hydrolase [Sansalvadorimonas verongulae]